MKVVEKGSRYGHDLDKLSRVCGLGTLEAPFEFLNIFDGPQLGFVGVIASDFARSAGL